MYFIHPYRPSEQPPLGLVLPGGLQLRRRDRTEERKAALPPDSTASKSPAAADLRQRQRWHFPPPFRRGAELALSPPFRRGAELALSPPFRRWSELALSRPTAASEETSTAEASQAVRQGLQPSGWTGALPAISSLQRLDWSQTRRQRVRFGPRKRPKFAGGPTFSLPRWRIRPTLTPKRRLALSPFPPVVLIEAPEPVPDGLAHPWKLPDDLPDALPGEAVLGPNVGLGHPESDPGGDLDVAIPEVLSAPVPALHGAAGLRRRRSVEPPGALLIAGSGSARTTQRSGRRLLPDQALHNAGTPIACCFVGRCRGPEGGGEAAALPYRCATSG